MLFRIVSCSPYIHNRSNTGNIMLLVLLAALPGMGAQWYFFGIGFLIQVLLATATALAVEGIVLRLRKTPVVPTLADNSAMLTALLLGISLPPLAPWWLVVTGTLFAIVIAKQLYGGLGQNIFNPAMVGYVAVLISFPIQMTSWLPPETLRVIKMSIMDSLSMIFIGHTLVGDTMQQLQMVVDGISQATPLSHLKMVMRPEYSTKHILSQETYSNSKILAIHGWQLMNLCYLLGGLLLLVKNVIRWHIPVSFLASLGFCSMFGCLFASETLNLIIVNLFSGATMLGAFFIATDPVTASTTNLGRLIYGTLIGLLVWLIRSFGGYPDGVAFAVLLANICVPLIDYYTQPRPYGHRINR